MSFFFYVISLTDSHCVITVIISELKKKLKRLNPSKSFVWFLGLGIFSESWRTFNTQTERVLIRQNTKKPALRKWINNDQKEETVATLWKRFYWRWRSENIWICCSLSHSSLCIWAFNLYLFHWTKRYNLT